MGQQIVLWVLAGLALAARFGGPVAVARELPQPGEHWLTLHFAGPYLAGFGGLVGMYLVWRGRGWWLKGGGLLWLVAGVVTGWPAAAEAVDLRFVRPQEATQIPEQELVLALRMGAVAKAYPLRYLASRRWVEDDAGGVGVLVVSTGDCHAAEVWSREVDGLELRFMEVARRGAHYLLRDQQTKSYWDPRRGVAVAGAWKGRQLRHVPAEELSLDVWDDEHPDGMLWTPQDGGEPGWQRQGKLRHWVEHGGKVHQYQLEHLPGGGVWQEPAEVVLLSPREGLGLRVYLAEHPETGAAMRFAGVNVLGEARMTDEDTGSSWNFRGCAVAGELKGKCLAPLAVRRFCEDVR